MQKSKGLCLLNSSFRRHIWVSVSDARRQPPVFLHFSWFLNGTPAAIIVKVDEVRTIFRCDAND